jgi:deoxyribodipyrimidine photolyase-related protein
MKSIGIILPNQLFEDSDLLDTKRTVFLIEHPKFFTHFKYHKAKLVLHRASMKMYSDFLFKQGYHVGYIEYQNFSSFSALVKKYKIDEVHYYRPFDHEIEQEFSEVKCKKVLYENPLFLTPFEWLQKKLKDKTSYLLHSFYVAQRKRMNILVSNNKPVGGKWSFDDQNREPFKLGTLIPKVSKALTNKYVTEAVKYVEKQFKNNPGTTEKFLYPVTFSASKRWFENFLKERFKNFGPYQDAMVQGESFLFHSVLTPVLNIGLLTPDYVIKETLSYAKKYKVPINSLEGFIRQVIGWREFVAGVYYFQGKKQLKSNFFKHRKKLSDKWYKATTGLIPVDDVIQKVQKTAYAHHIERLMVLGNAMLLCQIHPEEVYRWFMELFIDSYEWVMVPNVMGMSQYADGGLMVTKPYISGSNYILKMSDYKKGEWAHIWTSLYWLFIVKHKAVIAKNSRLKMMLVYLRNMKPETLKEHIDRAELFLKQV